MPTISDSPNSRRDLISRMAAVRGIYGGIGNANNMPVSSETNLKQPIIIPPLTPEEEDQVVLARITNDERPLKRVIKKFHQYTNVASRPLVSSLDSGGEDVVEDAREAFLVDLASFELLLKKSMMICEAEARQVEEYQREKQRIELEHGALRGQIEQLKTALENAQMIRRQKMEYDLVTEKVNTLPSRDELVQTIESLENDMAAIQTEHETQDRTIQTQKAALDNIIVDLASLRFIGKDRDAAPSSSTSPRATPALEGIGGEGLEDGATNGNDEPSRTNTATPGAAKTEEKEEGEEGEDKPADSTLQSENDIEMGEVEEEKSSRRKVREELEEGEATDASSELSEPPDDI
ncbi:hypothetical protein K435DRAFT_958962 [Dendrothele bispora CBS 962.96]|uniref:Uncharacterized protein n=1 Tax=Dendrothele bispora (strain CBS 962.96) TaxID=1314807 RepID=A0A4S8MY67_DENBC|nr:hypothetical protein K435DRAFT_958962 [Dendrothele bispora CBS 962.96]